jgi:mRNA-degrading endonuclease RelE of RelBE toxin-antitoxin system
MNIIYSPQAEKFLRKCDSNIRKRILKKIILYSSATEPLEFAEHLTDDPEAPYRYRIGKDWRVKFSVENKKMVIKRIGRRDDIYN